MGSSGVRYVFDTQVQFAELSNSLNRRGNKNVLISLNPEMCFKLTDYSFQRLKKKNVPDSVLDNLKDLDGKTCTSKDQFWEAVENQVGEEAEQYKELVFKYADTGDTGRGKLIRFYGAITPRKASEITPVQLEIVEEGQS
jgi:hypothetical protein